jgi:hypothetical protein
MGFASGYLQRHGYFGPFIPAAPEKNTSLIVVIPCFSEPDIIETLASLHKADRPSFPLEVIVAVNSPLGADPSCLLQNKKTLRQISCWSKKFSCPGFTIHAIEVPPFPVKHAGAGFARKAGMDEAVGRFNLLDNESGIIVSFDADSGCDTNYFTELEKCFAGPRTRGCTIYFEHPLLIPGSMDINYPILRYELYLRYFIEAMRFSGFPWAFHTIGSCFAVTAGVYAMQGGMNRKKAGEDFYFLHKVFPLGNFTELNSTRVVPSSRVSERVHFGTGQAIKRLMGNQGELLTYPPESFEELSEVFGALEEFYLADEGEIVRIAGRFPPFMQEYLAIKGFREAVVQARNNSAGLQTFGKRFFTWFNGLRMLQYLNFTRDRRRQDLPVSEAAGKLLEKKGIMPEKTEMCLLTQYRTIQREKVWKC